MRYYGYNIGSFSLRLLYTLKHLLSLLGYRCGTIRHSMATTCTYDLFRLFMVPLWMSYSGVIQCQSSLIIEFSPGILSNFLSSHATFFTIIHWYRPDRGIVTAVESPTPVVPNIRTHSQQLLPLFPQGWLTRFTTSIAYALVYSGRAPVFGDFTYVFHRNMLIEPICHSSHLI